MFTQFFVFLTSIIAAILGFMNGCITQIHRAKNDHGDDAMLFVSFFCLFTTTVTVVTLATLLVQG